MSGRFRPYFTQYNQLQRSKVFILEADKNLVFVFDIIKHEIVQGVMGEEFVFRAVGGAQPSPKIKPNGTYKAKFWGTSFGWTMPLKIRWNKFVLLY